jgi:hypothetical protein
VNAGIFEKARRILASPARLCAAAYPWEQGLVPSEYVGSVLVAARPSAPVTFPQFQANWNPSMLKLSLVSLPGQEFEFGECSEEFRVCIYGDPEVVALLLTDFWRFMRFVDLLRFWIRTSGG